MAAGQPPSETRRPSTLHAWFVLLVYGVRSKTTARPASTGIRRAFNDFWMHLSMKCAGPDASPRTSRGIAGYPGRSSIESMPDPIESIFQFGGPRSHVRLLRHIDVT